MYKMQRFCEKENWTKTTDVVKNDTNINSYM